VDRALAVAAAVGGSDRFVGIGADRIRAAAGGAVAAGIDGAPEELGRIVIHPGAAWSSKRYPAERWGKVAAALARATGRPIRGSPCRGAAELARQVERASGGVATSAEAPDLPRLVALLAGAALVLGGDTG